MNHLDGWQIPVGIMFLIVLPAGFWTVNRRVGWKWLFGIAFILGIVAEVIEVQRPWSGKGIELNLMNLFGGGMAVMFFPLLGLGIAFLFNKIEAIFRRNTSSVSIGADKVN